VSALESGWQRSLIGLGPSIFLGLVLVASGTGKAFNPAEFAEILYQLQLPVIGTSAPLIYLVSYGVPCLEIVLGILLLLGVLPRIAAALCIPLTIGFIVSNCWAMRELSRCPYCFGKWEELLGVMSPVQAFWFDTVLLCCALIVLGFHPSGWLNFRPWFIKSSKESR
jgi:uncharacterized membrane protein YphA (DoxX/SURF4 family)